MRLEQNLRLQQSGSWYRLGRGRDEEQGAQTGAVGPGGVVAAGSEEALPLSWVRPGALEDLP